LTIGVIKPSSSATATATSTVSQSRMASSLHDALAAGTCRNASAAARITKSLTEIR